IIKYLKYNYKGIDSVTLTGVKINPTGIPHIEGYINDDKEISFDAGIYDEHFEAALNFDFDRNKPEYRNGDNQVRNTTVSEIEKEEREQKKKEKAEKEESTNTSSTTTNWFQDKV